MSDSPTKAQRNMLGYLNLLSRQGRYEMYLRPHSRVINRRRAKSRVAKQSRKVNRGR